MQRLRQDEALDPTKVLEAENRSAMVSVITTVTLFGVIVLALRVGKVIAADNFN